MGFKTQFKDIHFRTSSKMWLSCKKKHNFDFMRYFSQSLNAKASKAIGEELARLNGANKLLSDAVKQSAGSFECKVSRFLKSQTQSTILMNVNSICMYNTICNIRR